MFLKGNSNILFNTLFQHTFIIIIIIHSQLFVECQLIFQVIHALSRTRVLHVWEENVVASQFLVPPHVEIHLSSIICHIKDKNHTRIQIKRHHLSTCQLFL